MLEFSQMLLRLVTALGLGAFVGLERESAGKEAGVGTSMMVAGGSAMFTLISLSIPYLIGTSEEHVASIIAQNAGFLSLIGNIVVGVGFLGAGIIIKTEERVHGLTTAAVIWVDAALGVLAGVGMTELAATSAVLVAGVLYAIRKIGLTEHLFGKTSGRR
jgi:putative Mg2+ transporter-C (MgtC) family protein